jgi:RAB protein geranylgeranyltransferase component A
VDKNDYYGGPDTAFSLREAEEWTKKVNDSNQSAKYRNAQIFIPQTADGFESKLAEQSRKYTLSLSPQLIYAQSKLLPALVSSRVHTQLEFQAVGSWWVYRGDKLQRIPSGREDVFADDTLSRKDKIALMKFLRSVVKEPEPEDTEDSEGKVPEDGDRPLATLLESDFKISQSLQQPLLALSLSSLPASRTKSSYALPRIKRHMTSIGAFGPGFGSVLPKYGGNAELAQVGCRAGAVGGGVYVLGADVVGQKSTDNPDNVKISLSNGETVTTSYVAGSMDDLSKLDWTRDQGFASNQNLAQSIHYIGIVSSPLTVLFPKTSENGPVPAGAIVLVDYNGDNGEAPPIYLQVHSEDTGECPSGQCKHSFLLLATTIPSMMIQLMNTYLHCLNYTVDTYPLTT